MEKVKFINKVYGRKKGRKKINFAEYNTKINKHLFSNSSKIIKKYKYYKLEVGFGDGENAINLSLSNKQHLIIACDVYKDGIINLMKRIEDKKISNLKIYDNNINHLLNDNFNILFDDIWILFPDPWPKNKHDKRKLINNDFITTLEKFTKKDSKIYIATDDKFYFIKIITYFYNNKKFIWQNDRPNLWSNVFNEMIETKYYKNALKNNRKPIFLLFQRK